MRWVMERGHRGPLGAHWDGSGVNFAVFSAHAAAVAVCIFDASGEHELARLSLPERASDIWHGYLAGAGPGLVYGLRADGLWRPEEGHRFNAAKLLFDPYARETAGRFEWHDSHFAGNGVHPLQIDDSDNAPWMLKARVTSDGFDWGPDRPPQIPLAETVLYELHVGGFSRLNPDVPEALRGTFAGLASDASVTHLKRLGVTAVSLLPIHLHLDEERLAAIGLTNYWGYNTLGFFCADPRFCSAGAPSPEAEFVKSPANEFRSMVKTLHATGIEVILDVVFNHTAESDERGPNLSFRGLDNTSYYRLRPDFRSGYENPTGCGNALDIRQPCVLRLVMDSLRYWVSEMHVDGFRFDLAPVLGRGDHGFDRNGSFFQAVAQDPVLSRVKMIAEPWDIGPGGYQLGSFPQGWLEWNDRFRDTMRSFWVKAAATRGDFALRLCGSSDLFQTRRRSVAESVNYAASHDGFTLLDLVSYDERHNLANGEGNRDGHAHNLSSNCGVEGTAGDPVVRRMRARLQRALLASTLLARGTPMLAAGDELGHTQCGNNNPYCQDNETSWIDWSRTDDGLIEFTSRLVALRRDGFALGGDWHHGGSGLEDELVWLGSAGERLGGEAWSDPADRALGCLIGRAGPGAVPLLLLINGGASERRFSLPHGKWHALLDTTCPTGNSDWSSSSRTPLVLAGHSLALLAAAEMAVDPNPGEGE